MVELVGGDLSWSSTSPFKLWKIPSVLKMPTNHKTELEKRNLAIDVPIKYTHITVNSGLDAEVCRHNVRSHLTF